MRVCSDEFKTKIKEFGRELDNIITFNEVEYGAENFNSITPVLQSSLLKSVMKELDIDSNIVIPIGTILNYKFGVKLSNGNYEYIDFGNYIVKDIEKQEETNSYNIVCYDVMLYSMRDYQNLQSAPLLQKEFPMTVRDYLSCIATDLGLVFANANDEFANYDKIIESDLYANIGYTYRDILDELAQVTASNIIINKNSELEIKYINKTDVTIDEESLKNINVKFGEKYGPINSIVLSRAGESDNVYLQDEESVNTNGLHELKISENQIMNFNDRSDYLPAILEKLNGLEYYINDYDSIGICYFEAADMYNVKVGENIYPCIMFNDEVKISQGLEENVHTDMPEQAQTDYTKADKTDRKINQTYIIVDKQNQQIESLVKDVDGAKEQLTQILQNITDIVFNIQNGGGNNLIKNSVGFAGIVEWEATFDSEETSTVKTISNVELLHHGTSGGAFQLNGVKIKQTINVRAGESYSFSSTVYKNAQGSGYIKIYNPINENSPLYFQEFKENQTYNYEDFNIQGIVSNYDTLIVEFYGTENSNLTLTDNMLNSGTLNSIWAQANGEILNTQVNINQNGVVVKSLQFDQNGQYTVISPLEFAGYADVNGTSTRVFSLNGDTTEVEKINVKSEISMPPIKIVPYNTFDLKGWVFIEDTGGE